LKIDHIGVAVHCIDSALELYRDGLGLEVQSRGVVEHELVEVAILPAGETRIELLEPIGPQSTIARYLEKRGEGLHHVAMEVEDLEAAVERLKEQGRRLVNESILTGAEGYRYVFVHPAAAGGVLLELIEK
jgi:methylmalonyl-CoA epimerase